MPRPLLASIVDDIDELDRAALMAALESLVDKANWTFGPPEFVDTIESSSVTQPGDEPIRTVGLVINVDAIGDKRRTSKLELSCFVHAIEDASRERSLEFELELDGTFVGSVKNGIPNRTLQVGLLDTWE